MKVGSGPAAVIGDEICNMPLSGGKAGWEGAETRVIRESEDLPRTNCRAATRNWPDTDEYQRVKQAGCSPSSATNSKGFFFWFPAGKAAWVHKLIEIRLCCRQRIQSPKKEGDHVAGAVFAPVSGQSRGSPSRGGF